MSKKESTPSKDGKKSKDKRGPLIWTVLNPWIDVVDFGYDDYVAWAVIRPKRKCPFILPSVIRGFARCNKFKDDCKYSKGVKYAVGRAKSKLIRALLFDEEYKPTLIELLKAAEAVR